MRDKPFLICPVPGQRLRRACAVRESLCCLSLFSAWVVVGAGREEDVDATVHKEVVEVEEGVPVTVVPVDLG